MMIPHRQLVALVLALAGTGAALPAKDHRDGSAKFGHNHDITVYDASVTEPTRVPAKIAYVEHGTPILTTTETILVLPTLKAKDENWTGTVTTITSTATHTVSVSPGQPDRKPHKGAVPVVVGGENGGPVVPRKSRPSPSSKASSPGEGSKLFGISYAPYRADHGCKSASDIDDDFHKFASDYSVVRIYGTDCDQVSHVYRSAKGMEVKLILGVWDIHDVENEASKIVAGLDGDWDIVHSISVGNELVNNGHAHPQQVIDAMRQARKILRDGGYQGPVVTVDTFIATEKYPELCEESDYCAINAHPFFDSTMKAGDAGKWLAGTVERVQSKLSKPMHIVITETGWPMDGASNGLAVPGLDNQKLAIDSIKEAFADHPGDVVLFSAFNDLWKEKSMATYNVDQFWGIGGAISRCDL